MTEIEIAADDEILERKPVDEWRLTITTTSKDGRYYFKVNTARLHHIQWRLANEETFEVANYVFRTNQVVAIHWQDYAEYEEERRKWNETWMR